ncbi:MAG: acyl-CoA dehydrogenase family protein [Halobacteriales archaeon]
MLDHGELDRGRHVNYWDWDPALRREVRRVLPDADEDDVTDKLHNLGRLMGDRIADNSDVVDREPPVLHTHDRDGEVVNEVERHPRHVENERLAFEAGCVADSFRPPEGRDRPHPLTDSLASYYLLCYSDVGLACAVSMTGGAALVLERHDPELGDYLDRLTRRDYGSLAQGAMFITERQGGSDVGANETTAEWDGEEGCYRLSGEKWFCSNVDAEVPLVLARTPGAPEGTAGLSMFVVPPEIQEDDDEVYRRLKDKLGTKSVPTGEVEFDGARAYMVGEEGRGFKYMTAMLNYERVTNAMGSCGGVARALLEAKVHAANREAFGRALDRHPLMQADLVWMTVEHEAATAFSFDAVRAFHGHYREDDEEAYRLMRAIVPVAKYVTGELAVEISSYSMEVHGGDGYTEDWVTERLLRDAQVAPIWEGTSNILSLDLLRSMAKEASHEAVVDRLNSYLDDAEHPYLVDVADDAAVLARKLETSLEAVATGGESYAQLQAKRLADELYDAYASALLVSEAQDDVDDGDGRLALVARYFVDSRDGGVRDDEFEIEWFDAISRYGEVDPDELPT